MNRRLLTATLSSLALVAALSTATAAEEAAEDDAAKIERGRYLVTFGGCNDCHTPWQMGENGPEPDMSRMLSGHPQQMEVPPPPELGEGPWNVAIFATFTAWSGPWGKSYTRNLTPDEETGLGTWTEQEFLDTLRNGKERGIGRDLQPPMPWPTIGQATDEDLKAIWAYLQSIPAVSNRVPDNVPPAAPAH